MSSEMFNSGDKVNLVKRFGTTHDGEHYHRCYFKLERIAAWRITPYPVHMAIRLRVFACGCGKTFLTEGEEIIMGGNRNA